MFICLCSIINITFTLWSVYCDINLTWLCTYTSRQCVCIIFHYCWCVLYLWLVVFLWYIWRGTILLKIPTLCYCSIIMSLCYCSIIISLCYCSIIMTLCYFSIIMSLFYWSIIMSLCYCNCSYVIVLLYILNITFNETFNPICHHSPCEVIILKILWTTKLFYISSCVTFTFSDVKHAIQRLWLLNLIDDFCASLLNICLF